MVGTPPPSSEAKAPGPIKQARAELSDGFKQLAELISHVRKPLPTQTGDGSDLDKEDSSAVIAGVESGLRDLWSRGISGSVNDISTLLEVQAKGMSGALIDDKSYLMERLINVAANLPDDSALRHKITDNFLTQLWNDLQHPPQSYLGADYQYRSADGSHNSLIHPDLGKAGTPYARTVQPMTMRAGAQPDPEVVFDSVLMRTHREKHPNKISSVLFYLASIIIHDLFRTSHKDFAVSETSSYLDLSPLYGSNIDEQKLMRDEDPKKARGHIKADCFSEKRLLMFPPGVGVLLVMFNRFHNHTVDQLAAINEGGRFPFPGENGTDAKWKQYDEDLFQTARLITCGLYINIILVDYVRTILNLNKTDSNWQLNPRANIKNGPPQGTGNQVSAEFNLVYRWHSTISERDEVWTEELFKSMFPGQDPLKMNWHDFIKNVQGLQDKTPADPQKRPFHGLARNPDGTLPDDALVDIISSSVDDCANSYGANRVPGVMRAVEVLGIMQARAWNVCSLNEFRKHFGLTPHKTFKDINSDVGVQESLKRLYEHPDLVELYPGLVVEEAKQPMVPGSGLATGFTLSRGVLSDATALTRGDRFYTIDYHPRKLTNWGFTEVKSDTDIDHGCVFYKLFLRAFPKHFAVDSVYAHFPLTISSETRSTLRTLKKEGLYTYDKPKRIPDTQIVFSHAAAAKVLGDPKSFTIPSSRSTEFLLGSAAKEFLLAGDLHAANTQTRQLTSKPEWNGDVRNFFEQTTLRLLKEKAYTLAGANQIDIIRDLGNLVNVHFAAELFNLPLKTAERPHQVFTEAELYLILSAINICAFFDLDPGSSFPLRQKAYSATRLLGTLVGASIDELKAGGLISWVAAKISSSLHGGPAPDILAIKQHGHELITQLLKSGIDQHQLVWGQILGTAGAMVPGQGQLFGQVMEYLVTDGAEHLPALRALALKPASDAAAFEQIKRYVLEAARLNGETGVFRSVAGSAGAAVELQDTQNGAPRTLNLNKGDTILLNLRAASRDPAVFPDPETLRLDRPLAAYDTLGYGPQRGLGQGTTWTALAAMVRVVARLQNLRPVKGPQGRVKKVVAKVGGLSEGPEGVRYHKYLTENWDAFWPWPMSLKVNWDGDLLGLAAPSKPIAAPASAVASHPAAAPAAAPATPAAAPAEAPANGAPAKQQPLADSAWAEGVTGQGTG